MDKAADIIAKMDQFGQHLASMAVVMAQYRRALRAEGFSEEQTQQIVRDWHRIWWEQSLRQMSLGGGE